MMQLVQMMASRTFALLSIVAFAGCSDGNENAASTLMPEKPSHASTGPNYGSPQKIAAPFRFEFEVSSIEFCSSPRTKEAPACPDDSRHCWLEFDDKANRDMDGLTKQHFIAEEGSYWMEGIGRVADSTGGFGHLGSYECQVEMTEVSRFIKISGQEP